MIVEYHRPETISEALELLGRVNPLTVPLGGGTILSKKRKPDFAVVDLQKLGLNRIQADDRWLHFGATVTLQQVLDFDSFPEGLKEHIRISLEHECSANLRRVVTLAGLLVSCDGRSSLATALLALDANLVWAPGGEKQPLGDFLPLRKPFGRERLMVEIGIPSETELQIEMVARTPMDRPVVCAAVARWPSGRTRVALGGHGNAPVLAMDGLDSGGAELAAREAYRYSGDQWASAEYRMEVAGVLTRRMLGMNMRGYDRSEADRPGIH